MANTVIQLKKASSSGAVPTNLANGEISLDHFTGNLWFKAANGTYRLINAPGVGGGGSNYGTVNVDDTLLVSATSGDVVNMITGIDMKLIPSAANDTVQIHSTTGRQLMIAHASFVP